MQKVYLNILSKEQVELIPLLKKFNKDYYLVGGTAIALQLGHRESIDFDLFTIKNKNQFKTLSEIQKHNTSFPIVKLKELKEQSHYIINSVKVTFFNYPYKVESLPLFETIKTPNLLTLAAMKAFALGKRAKWKDYVDLCFILESGVLIADIIEKAKKLFNDEKTIVFVERIFLEQLMYYDDVSYEEEVIYTTSYAPTILQIQEKLKTFVIKHIEK